MVISLFFLLQQPGHLELALKDLARVGFKPQVRKRLDLGADVRAVGNQFGAVTFVSKGSVIIVRSDLSMQRFRRDMDFGQVVYAVADPSFNSVIVGDGEYHGEFHSAGVNVRIKAVSSLTFSQDGALLALKAESHPKFSPDPPNAHRIRETRWPVTEKDGVRIEARFVTPEGVRLSAGTAALELSSNALHEEWPYLTYSPLQGAEHGFISLVCGRAKFPYGVYLLRGNALTELAVSMRPVTSATPRHGLFYSYNQDRWTLRDPDARSASTWRSPLLPFWMPGTSLVLLSYPGGPNATVVDLGKA